jgi:hypothetical protein
VVGRFRRAASARSAEDTIAGEHERAARLLEAWCDEAFEVVTRAEQETRRLLDELAGTVPHPSIHPINGDLIIHGSCGHRDLNEI